MVTYKYVAMSDNGQKVSGVIEAFNEMDAVDRLKQNHSIIIKMTPVKGEGEGFLNMEIGGNKLNNKAFIVMCSQFAIILNAGIPIARTVHLIAEKTSDKPLKKMLLKVGEDVEAGRSVAASFAERGEKLLPPTFVETIAAGEQSGNLDKAFQTVHEHFDKQAKMAAKVRSAMAYPLFVLFIAVAVVAVLMIKVVPTFTAIFDSMGGELPGVTKALIAISNFFIKYWMILVAIIAVVVIVYKVYGNTEEGRMNLAKWSLKVPILGNIQELNAASEFANTMTTMLASGLPMTRAISITAKTMSNYFMSTETGKLAVKLEEGRGLGQSMREANYMPDILVDMVAVGEETGEMEKTLNTIAKYYDAELDMAIASALAKLEPALLVGLAGIAGFIVIAIYMAMFGMYAIM
ncbi:MAG: type II secretion system F family protein [Oscillospiraceae bacterium]|nr:type II secretion system F family protein [Oscillospiraceae bacterium]